MTKTTSIAMASYNGESYIRAQINSLINQSHAFDELIIVDDCSTDTTRDIINSFSDDKRIKLIKNNINKGVIFSFEKALKNCSGDFILLCDQDDYWFENKIEVLITNISKYSLIYSNVYLLGDSIKDKRLSFKSLNPIFSIDSNNKEFHRHLIFNSFVLGCSVMFKKEVLELALPILKSERNHDWWLVLCASVQNGVKYINEPLMHYRIHSNNLSINNNSSLFYKFSALLNHKRSIQTKNKHEIIKIAITKFKDKIHDFKFYKLCLKHITSFEKITFKRFFYTIQLRKYLFPHVNETKRIVLSIINSIIS